MLYPKVDQNIVDPTDYAKWEQLIFQLASHYKQKGLTGLYWEVGNEGDIGESGGSPIDSLRKTMRVTTGKRWPRSCAPIQLRM